MVSSPALVAGLVQRVGVLVVEVFFQVHGGAAGD